MSGEQGVGLDDAQREPARDGVVGRDPLARVQRQRGALAAHHDRHQEAARGLGHDAERHEGRPQPRAAGDQHEIAVEEHGQADAHSEPVHRGDQRLLERGDRIDEAWKSGTGIVGARRAADGSMLDHSPRSWPAENARPLPVSTTHAMSSRVLASRNAARARVVQRGVERVERVGPVESEQPHAVVVVDSQHAQIRSHTMGLPLAAAASGSGARSRSRCSGDCLLMCPISMLYTP